jgi:hypothetical protein
MHRCTQIHLLIIWLNLVDQELAETFHERHELAVYADEIDAISCPNDVFWTFFIRFVEHCRLPR